MATTPAGKNQDPADCPRLLFEEDATGQGRELLWDRNWEVVSQSVPGGSTTSIATPVTLFSQKIGE
jgi:hypothetical protein